MPRARSKEEYLNIDVSEGRDEPKTKRHTVHMKKRMFYFVVFLVVLIVGVAMYQYTKSPAYQVQKVAKENKALLDKVKGMMILPNEDPAIFIIQDPESLIKQQPFFVGSQKDDRLLLYPKAGKAIIYSPSRNIIVNVGPINFPTGAGK